MPEKGISTVNTMPPEVVSVKLSEETFDTVPVIDLNWIDRSLILVASIVGEVVVACPTTWTRSPTSISFKSAMFEDPVALSTVVVLERLTIQSPPQLFTIN